MDHNCEELTGSMPAPKFLDEGVPAIQMIRVGVFFLTPSARVDFALLCAERSLSAFPPGDDVGDELRSLAAKGCLSCEPPYSSEATRQFYSLRSVWSFCLCYHDGGTDNYLAEDAASYAVRALGKEEESFQLKELRRLLCN